jgi:hypothetical protein
VYGAQANPTKNIPKIKGTKHKNKTIQSGVTYAQVGQGQTEIPPRKVTHLNPMNMTQPANDLTELKQIMKNLMDQMGTLINLISELVNKNNKLAQLLKIAVGNANGLCQHAQEIKLFLQTFKLDILLVSETHFTKRSYITIPNYITYYTNHPDETAQGGSTVIIRKKKH